MIAVEYLLDLLLLLPRNIHLQKSFRITQLLCLLGPHQLQIDHQRAIAVVVLLSILLLLLPFLKKIMYLRGMQRNPPSIP